jgi:hypothetical protein
MQRRHFTAVLLILLAACASPEFRPLVFPPDIALQDPPPGAAIVYLLRAPHDRQTVEVFFGTKALAVLPPATYTVVVVPPGRYEIKSGSSGKSEEAPVSTLTVSAGERRFLYTTVPTRTGMTIGFIPGGRIGVIPLFLPGSVPAGARTWNECRELDAQGLMSTSKLVLPASDASMHFPAEGN